MYKHHTGYYEKYIKRLLDIIIALLVFMVMIIPLVIIAILIKLDSPGPVFFNQERVGKDGKLFTLFKFRTMVVNAINMGAGVLVEKEDPRVTKVGKWLRDLSLDELPQLINVLIGDISTVGPRPTLKYQVDKYSDFQRQRLLVKPGITGLAQIKGRKSIDWDKRIEFDVQYVNNMSLFFDFYILLKTIPVVLFRKDNLAKSDFWKDK